jgi:hypothetical protein
MRWQERLLKHCAHRSIVAASLCRGVVACFTNMAAQRRGYKRRTSKGSLLRAHAAFAVSISSVYLP